MKRLVSRRDFLKRTAAVGSGAMFLSLLAACGTKPAPAPTAAPPAPTQEAPVATVAAPTAVPQPTAGPAVEVYILTSEWWKGVTGEEDQATATFEDFWKFIFEEFKKLNPQYEKATLKVEIVGWDVYDEKIRVMVAAQNWPDLVMHVSETGPLYAPQGVVEPIDDYLTDADKADFEASALKPGVWQGKTYTWPWNGYGTCLAVNKQIFTDAGATSLLPDANGFWDFDQFLQACQAVTKGDVYGLGVGFKDNAGDYQRYSFLWGRGASIFSEDGKSYTFNSQAGIDGLQWLVDTENKWKVMTPGAAGLSWDDVNQSFYTAKAAIIPGAQWDNTTAIKRLADSGQLDPAKVQVIPAMFPNLKGIDPPRTYAGADGWVAFKQKDDYKRKLLMEFCHYGTSAETQKYNKVGFFLPVRKSAADMWSDDSFMQWLSKYAFKYAHPDTSVRGYMQTLNYLVPAFQEAITMQKTPKQVLDGAKDPIEKMLATL